jgi:hypothetical protein
VGRPEAAQGSLWRLLVLIAPLPILGCGRETVPKKPLKLAIHVRPGYAFHSLRGIRDSSIATYAQIVYGKTS